MFLNFGLQTKVCILTISYIYIIIFWETRNLELDHEFLVLMIGGFLCFFGWLNKILNNIWWYERLGQIFYML